MTSSPYLQIFGLSDVGCVRSGNEDCFTVQPIGGQVVGLNPANLFKIDQGQALFAAVSDGMGGAAAGELASQTALTTFGEYLSANADILTQSDPEKIAHLLEEGVHLANKTIYQKSSEVTGSRGMGATITAGFISKDILYLFQIGDSRAYVLRGDALHQITRDQSFVGHLVEMGTITEEQAMRHPQRNVILQALGSNDRLKVDVSFLPLCKNDLVLICSDGLHGEFLPNQFERIVKNAAGDDLEALTQALVEEAKRAGGRDNITLVSMRAGASLPEAEPGEKPQYKPFANLEEDNPLKQSDSMFR